MNEDIRTRVAMLNTVWQLYARAVEQDLDTIPMDALKRDYLAAWKGLDACGIADWMLVYDPTTLTFALPEERKVEDGSGDGTQSRSLGATNLPS